MFLNPRHWPWWGWVVAVAATVATVLLSGALAYRQNGIHALRLELTRAQAAGRGAFPEDLLARAPAIDVKRQERAQRLLTDSSSPGYGAFGDVSGMRAHFAAPRERAKVDSDMTRLLAVSTVDRAEWRAINAEGPTPLSWLAWWLTNHPGPAVAALDLDQIRFTSLLRARELAQAFATEAYLATDPRPALAAGDALVAAMDQPQSLLDAMIRMAIADIQDDAWLEATLRGIDPTPWCAAPPHTLWMMEQAAAAERMFIMGYEARRVLAGGTTAGPSYVWSIIRASKPASIREDLQQRLIELNWWFLSPADLALQIRWFSAWESLCHDGTGDPAAIVRLANDSWRTPAAALQLANYAECIKTFATHDVAARRMRLAGALVHFWQRKHQLPDALHELPTAQADLAHARSDLPDIRYTRISPDHFRLDCDPATPGTQLVPAGAITTKAWTRREPFQSGRWMLEFDLDPQSAVK